MAVPAMTEFYIDPHSSRAGRPCHGPGAKFDGIYELCSHL